MRQTLLLLHLCVMLVVLSPPAPVAAESAPGAWSIDDVQAAFQRAGYIVGRRSSWSDEANTFAVWHPEGAQADRPVLRVFVYPDAVAASAAHRRAHANDESRRNRPIAPSDDWGPQILTGYGASTWRHNVAVVQASPPGDIGSYPVEPNCDPEPIVTATTGLEQSSRDFVLPTTGVDARFVALLELASD